MYEALRSAFTGCTLMPHASFVILTDTKETHNTVSTGLLRACPNHVASCGVRTSAQVGEACAWLSPRSAVWAPWEKGSFHRTFQRNCQRQYHIANARHLSFGFFFRHCHP